MFDRPTHVDDNADMAANAIIARTDSTTMVPAAVAIPVVRLNETILAATPLAGLICARTTILEPAICGLLSFAV